MPLAGRPILGHALRGALRCPRLAHVVVVVPPGWQEAARAVVAEGGQAAYVTVVAGGAERHDSVAAGLAALDPAAQVVLVHDAARCLTPAAVFDRVSAEVRAGAPAVVPGVPVVDTIKQVDERGLVTATPERALLRAVQTPQGFRRDVLERAHASATGATGATDDAGLVERIGQPVRVVPGDPRAAKVTTSDDLAAAARILGR